VRNGVVKFTPQKTAHSTGFELQCPLHVELARVIAATPTIGVMNYIIGKGGKPLKSETLGSYMRAWCDEAGLPEVSAHGLRKAVCRRMAEAGATVHQIAAITGHRDLKEIQIYTQAVDQARLAHQSVELMTGRR
jgi:integrase